MRPIAKFSDMYQKIFYIHKKLCVTVCGFTFSGMSSSSLLYPSSISQEIETKKKVEFQYERLGHFTFFIIYIFVFSVAVVAQMEKNGTNAFSLVL